MSALPYWRLSGYYFFYFAFNGAFMPFFGLYLHSLGFSAWEIGVFMSLMQVMRLFGPNLWGWLADRSHRQLPIVRWAGLVSLLGFSAFFWLRDFLPMLLAMGVLTFFWSAALPLVEALTFNHLRERPEYYSRIRLWGSVGFVVAVLAAGFLLDFLPIARVVDICWGLLAGILLLALLLPEPRPLAAGREALPLGDILAQRRVRALLLACFAMSAAHGALYAFYSLHLAAHAYSHAWVGALWSLGVLAEIAVFLGMARWLRRHSLRAILLASYAAAVLRFLLVGWCIDWLAIAALAQLMHGLTFGAYHAASITVVNRWFPGRAQARGQALYSSLSFGAGGLLGTLLSGWMWDSVGAEWTFTLSAFFALWGWWVLQRGISEGDL